ncbi:transmembrane protein 6/97, partial [Dimargaris cristalligena]
LIDRPVDLLLFIYFVVHVPIILFIDSQNILPTQFFPGFLRSILRSWVDASGDPFVQMDPGPLDPNLIWFSTIVTIEMLFHVPFNCYAAYELYRDSPCFDLPLLMMGVHSATFVVPMVASLWLGFPQLTLDQRFTLTKMYGPYVFITIGMA